MLGAPITRDLTHWFLALRAGVVSLLFGLLVLCESPAQAQSQKQAEQLELIQSLNGRVSDLVNQRKFEQAYPLAKKALSLCRKTYGYRENTNSVLAICNLAMSRQSHRDIKTADRLFHDALKMQTMLSGPKHPEFALVLLFFGTYCANTGQHSKALECFTEALSIYTQSFGTNHLRTAWASLVMGLVYSKMADKALAEYHLTKALPVLEARDGAHGALTGLCLTNLCSLFISYDEHLGQDPEILSATDQLLLDDRCLEVIRICTNVLCWEEKLYGTYPPRRIKLVNLKLLGHLSQAYSFMGDDKLAISPGEQEVKLSAALYGTASDACIDASLNLVVHYTAQEQFDKAGSVVSRLLKILPERPDMEPLMSCSVYQTAGYFYLHMGSYEEALRCCNQALAVRNIAPLFLIATKQCMANAHIKKGNYAEAEMILSSIAPDIQTLQTNNQLACTIGNKARLVELLIATGRFAEAEERCRELIDLGATSGHKDFAQKTNLKALTELAKINLRQGKADTAFELSKQALREHLLRGTTNGLHLHDNYATIARALDMKGHSLEAVFFGKMAVNSVNEQRQRQHTLKEELQESFLVQYSDDYRFLAELLLRQGRIGEAEQALDMLKRQEFAEYVRIRPERGTQAVGMDPQERQLLAGYTEAQDNVLACRRELSELEDERLRGHVVSAESLTITSGLLFDESQNDESQNAHSRVSSKLRQALTAHDNTLVKMLHALHGAGNGGLDQMTVDGWRTPMRKLSPSGEVVFLRYLVAPTNLYIVFTSARTQKIKSVPVLMTNLSCECGLFRDSLERRGLHLGEQSRQLYRWLVEPIEPELRLAGAKTLLITSDRALRYVPFAALLKGTNYLIEDFQIVMIPSGSLSDYGREAHPASTWGAAGMGLTDDLPNVARELESIVRTAENTNGILLGNIWMNKSFTKEVFKSSATNATKVVHVATHAKCDPVSLYNSYLCLGGAERLEMRDIMTEEDWTFDGVELVTLSACETAELTKDLVGNEVDGMASVPLARGAQSVLASLWKVADFSTSQMMAKFYELWVKGKLSKAEALRQAQIAMMRGKLDPAAAGTDASSQDFTHPFYWAPFELFGNWH